jgi:hypothetical protein
MGSHLMKLRWHELECRIGPAQQARSARASPVSRVPVAPGDDDGVALGAPRRDVPRAGAPNALESCAIMSSLH